MESKRLLELDYLHWLGKKSPEAMDKSPATIVDDWLVVVEVIVSLEMVESPDNVYVTLAVVMVVSVVALFGRGCEIKRADSVRIVSASES